MQNVCDVGENFIIEMLRVKEVVYLQLSTYLYKIDLYFSQFVSGLGYLKCFSLRQIIIIIEVCYQVKVFNLRRFTKDTVNRQDNVLIPQFI